MSAHHLTEKDKDTTEDLDSLNPVDLDEDSQGGEDNELHENPVSQEMIVTFILFVLIIFVCVLFSSLQIRQEKPLKQCCELNTTFTIASQMLLVDVVLHTCKNYTTNVYTLHET